MYALHVLLRRQCSSLAAVMNPQLMLAKEGTGAHGFDTAHVPAEAHISRERLTITRSLSWWLIGCLQIALES